MPNVILLVDDEPRVLKTLRRVLEDEGYETLTAENGETCLAIIQNRHVDLLVLDIIMPGMDGWEVLRAIREQPALSHLPVVILSTRKASIDRMLGLDVFGVEHYLTKPPSPDDLLTAVGEVLTP